MSARFDFNRATPVTTAILALCVALALATDPVDPSYAQHERYGAMIGARVMLGEFWRLVTYAFLHGGLMHIAFNLYALWHMGPQVERLLGGARFATLWLVTAIGSGIAGCLWHSPIVPLVGASGSLFGLFGAMVALNVRHGKSPLDFLQYEGPRQLLGVIAINLVLGLMIPQVSNAGHVGGLVTGIACGFAFLSRPRGGKRDLPERALLGAAAALFLALLFWCVHPVTRWDYLLYREQHATSEPEHERFAEALREVEARDPEVAMLRQWLATEEEFAPLARRLLR